MGRQREGLSLLEKAVDMEPYSEAYVGSLAHGYRWIGADAQARLAYEKATQLALQDTRNSDSGRLLADLGLYNGALGRAELSDRYFQRARAQNPSDLDILYKEAVAASLLSVPGRALELLKRVCERGCPMVLAENNIDFAGLRKMPEFTSIRDRNVTPEAR